MKNEKGPAVRDRTQAPTHSPGEVSMTGNMNATLKEALALAKQRIPVFPCRKDKRPATAHGFKDATTDVAKITRWWSSDPTALIGVPTGHASGLNVLDVDDLKALKEVPIVVTRTHRTRSGGLHLLFAVNGEEVRNSTSKLAKGLDVRGEGGYIIWWPAHGFAVVNPKNIAPTPEWLGKKQEKAPKLTVVPVPTSSALPLTWPLERKRIEKDLSTMDPDMDYESWTRVGMALYHESNGHEEGLNLFLAWSSKGKKFNPEDWPSKWVSFKTDRTDKATWAGVRAKVQAPLVDVEEEEPLIQLSIVEDLIRTQFKPVERIFDGAIPLTPGVNILAGKPKHGKSWLAMGLAIAGCTGEEYLGTKPTTPMQTFYLALDDSSESRFSRRVNAFKPAGSTRGMVLGTKISKKVTSSLELLDGIVAKYPTIRFVVIDTLAAFRQGLRGDNPYQQEYDEVKAINDWAHKRNIAVLLVHHLRKGEVEVDNPFESISGTLGLQGACDGMMVLARKDLHSDFDEALDEKLAGVWYRNRDLDNDIDIGMRLHEARWHLVGRSADVFAAGTQREILSVLASDPDKWWTSKEMHVAGDFNCKPDSVKKAATRMAKQGKIDSHRGAMPGASGGGGGFRLLRKKG